MSEFQKNLLEETFNAVRHFRLVNILINSIVFVPVAVLAFWIAQITFNWVSIPIIFLVAILYSLARELFADRRVKKMLFNQVEYLYEKHPDVTIVIPVLQRAGKKSALKSSALFIRGDRLFLEAFRHTLTSSSPTDSITVPEGSDLLIHSVFLDSESGLVRYDGILIDTDYFFYTINNPRITEALIPFVHPDQNGAEPNADTAQ